MRKIKPKNKLAGILAEYGITHRELARHLGVSEATFTSWIKGNTSPQIDTCILIHEFIKSRGAQLTLHELFS